MVFFFSSRRRHTRFKCDWSSDVCSSDLRGGSCGASDRSIERKARSGNQGRHRTNHPLLDGRGTPQHDDLHSDSQPCLAEPSRSAPSHNRSLSRLSPSGREWTHEKVHAKRSHSRQRFGDVCLFENANSSKNFASSDPPAKLERCNEQCFV